MDLGDIMDDGQNTITPQINYELLVEDALRAVVRSSLRIAEDNGLPGNTHFYITFLTDADGVEVPERLKESHPERMTIVIQHQYWELNIHIYLLGIQLVKIAVRKSDYIGDQRSDDI